MTTTYDSAIDTLMGDKLMLFVTDGSSTLPIAFGTSCNIDLSADTVDTIQQDVRQLEGVPDRAARLYDLQRVHDIVQGGTSVIQETERPYG